MTTWSEIKSFLLHLRLHYQFLILSGAFLSGAVFAGGPRGMAFLAQFLNVHVFLFGGVTVYNSFWDKDKGAIGGLRFPPKLAPWTLWASWLLQFTGLAFSLSVSLVSGAVYGLAIFFFFCYSRPGIRWKGRPLLGLLAIGISTGVCGFLLGYLHSDQKTFLLGSGAVKLGAGAGAMGVACLIMSLFPMSQVYQVAEDLARNDTTFTAVYGLRGVRFVFALLFPLGVILLSMGLMFVDFRLGWIFLVLGAVAGLGIGRILQGLKLSPHEYGRVMGVKYVSSGLFVIFLTAVLILQSINLIGSD